MAANLRRTSRSGISYLREGDGGPPVLFLHGWSLNGQMWMYAQNHLVESFETIVPDLPGLGRSDGLGGPYNVERHTEAIVGLLDELECDDTVLVGFAYGGAVAMEVALRSPRVAGLALVGIPKSGELPVERMLRSMARDWPEYARRSAAAICKQPQSDATLRWLESMFVATRIKVAQQTWSDISEFDPVPVAAKLTQPTLFIHGDEDDFTPLSVSEEASAAAEQGRLAVASPSGHLVLLDQPGWLHETLSSFLLEVS